MGKNVGFQRWHYRAEGAVTSPVFPDGCRDLLVVRGHDGSERIVLTEFDLRPQRVSLSPGTEIVGFRLRPGAVIDQRVLAAIRGNRGETEEILSTALEAAEDMDDPIIALTLPRSTVQSVANDLGVSVRTMQRRFRDLHLPPPDYWRLLARARRAGAMLSSRLPLVDIACDSGFSDQAHMTREFARWFGNTPTRLRGDASLLDLVSQPALGNWTGEQISTR